MTYFHAEWVQLIVSWNDSELEVQRYGMKKNTLTVDPIMLQEELWMRQREKPSPNRWSRFFENRTAETGFRFGFTKLSTVRFLHCVLFNVYDARNDVLPCWIGPTNCQPKWLRTRSAEMWHEEKYSDCWSYHAARWTVNETMWKTVPKLPKLVFFKPNRGNPILYIYVKQILLREATHFVKVNVDRSNEGCTDGSEWEESMFPVADIQHTLVEIKEAL